MKSAWQSVNYIKNRNSYFWYWVFIFISGCIGHCHYLRTLIVSGVYEKKNIYNNE